MGAVENATRTAATRGLVVGVPEHDWSGVKDKFFYSNNVWLLRGMEELGALLTAGANVSLGSKLLGDVGSFREDIRDSLSACTVSAQGQAYFLPPWAEVNMTPFKSMTAATQKSTAIFASMPRCCSRMCFRENWKTFSSPGITSGVVALAAHLDFQTAWMTCPRLDGASALLQITARTTSWHSSMATWLTTSREAVFTPRSNWRSEERGGTEILLIGQIPLQTAAATLCQKTLSSVRVTMATRTM